MRIKLYEEFLNLIFPRTCGYCEEITANRHYICDSCIKKYKYDFMNKCKLCGKTTYNREEICNDCLKKNIYYNELRYVTYYEDIIKQRMTEYKFFEKKYLINFFSELIYENLEKIEADLIIPIPIGRERRLERGYNQSELIARQLSDRWTIPLSTKILKKIRETSKQSKLNLHERRRNVRGVFEVTNIEKINDKRIVLIDDIFTTGATVNEASRMLKQRKTGFISIIVIARGHSNLF